jgi:hypothetical protein
VAISHGRIESFNSVDSTPKGQREKERERERAGIRRYVGEAGSRLFMIQCGGTSFFGFARFRPDDVGLAVGLLCELDEISVGSGTLARGCLIPCKCISDPD